MGYILVRRAANEHRSLKLSIQPRLTREQIYQKCYIGKAC